MDAHAEEAAGVSGDQVRYALRRMRPDCLRIDSDGALWRVALVMDASTPGRRNAAQKIVDYLAAHGMRLDAADPVDELTGSTGALTVLVAR